MVDKDHVLQKLEVCILAKLADPRNFVLPPSGCNGFPSSMYHKALEDKHMFPRSPGQSI